MSWLTFKSGKSLFHMNMDRIKTVRVDIDEDGKADTVNFFFIGDANPSLQIQKKDGAAEAAAKCVSDFLYFVPGNQGKKE